MQVDRREQEQVVERFMTAVTTGDVQGLMDVLAPDVVLVADGGGVAQAVRRPVEGADRVTAFLSVFPRLVTEAAIATIWLNGAPAARIDTPKFGTTVVSVAVENGRITRIYAMRNPSKLARLDEEAELTR
jgi:RNA polymerase sigma-70 factor (ECF subfamily)